MKLIYSFVQFLISEWIWSFTFALYHPIITVLIMTLLLIKYAKQKIIPSVFYAICSQVYASLMFTLIIHVIFDMVLGITFDAYETNNMIHPLASCFLLGMIYSGLQISFFALIRAWYRFPFERFSIAVCISNTVAALIVFKFLPVL